MTTRETDDQEKAILRLRAQLDEAHQTIAAMRVTRSEFRETIDLLRNALRADGDALRKIYELVSIVDDSNEVISSVHAIAKRALERK